MGKLTHCYFPSMDLWNISSSWGTIFRKIEKDGNECLSFEPNEEIQIICHKAMGPANKKHPYYYYYYYYYY